MRRHSRTPGLYIDSEHQNRVGFNFLDSDVPSKEVNSNGVSSPELRRPREVKKRNRRHSWDVTYKGLSQVGIVSQL
jgi:hypothetical protein